jgi:hypothetical protein
VADEEGLKEEDGSDESVHANKLGTESYRNGEEEEAAVADDVATAGNAADEQESIELVKLV